MPRTDIAASTLATLNNLRVHRAAIIKAVQIGVPVGHAAQAAGVRASQMRAWMSRGYNEIERLEELAKQGIEAEPDEIEGEFARFWDDVQVALSQSVVRGISNIQKAATGGIPVRETTRTYVDAGGKEITETIVERSAPDWRAAAWHLERGPVRQEFGRTAATDLGPNGEGISAEGLVAGGVDIAALAARVANAAAAVAAQAATQAAETQAAIESGFVDAAIAASAARATEVVAEVIEDQG